MFGAQSDLVLLLSLRAGALFSPLLALCKHTHETLHQALSVLTVKTPRVASTGLPSWRRGCRRARRYRPGLSRMPCPRLHSTVSLRCHRATGEHLHPVLPLSVECVLPVFAGLCTLGGCMLQDR